MTRQEEAFSITDCFRCGNRCKTVSPTFTTAEDFPPMLRRRYCAQDHTVHRQDAYAIAR
jgi:hypothetical protein